MAQDVFVDDVDHFVVHDMTLKHEFIADNTYDHVFSFGALGMYLTKPQMLMQYKRRSGLQNQVVALYLLTL